MVFPRPSEIQHTSPKHVLQNLVDPLSLSISLRMVRGTQIQFCAQRLLECSPELASEYGISITYNARRDAMESHNLPHICIRQTGGGSGCLDRDEVGRLGQSVDYHPNAIVPPSGLWQTVYEIHRNLIPFPARNLKRLE